MRSTLRNKALILACGFVFLLNPVYGQFTTSREDESIAGLTAETLGRDFSFFGADSLSGYDYVKGYNKAVEFHNINMVQELKAFFHKDEWAFVKNKYRIKEEPVQVRRIDNPISSVSIGCNNLDFENGDYTGWDGTVGYNTNSNSSLTVTGTGIYTLGTNQSVDACTYHTLVTAAAPNDPYGNFPVLSPAGGTYSVRLGGSQINTYQGNCMLPTQDYGYSSGESLEQTFVVTPSNAIVTYYYAVVLQDTPHPSGQQPYFSVEVLDQSGNLLPACYQYYQASLPNNGGSPPGYWMSSVWGYSYLPWSSNRMDLSGYIGQQITMRFTAAGCTSGGHSAHAYIDVECGSSSSITITGNNINCQGTGIDSLVAPSYGATYHWTGPGIIGSNTGQTIRVNQAGQYTVAVYQQSGCNYYLSVIVPGPLQSTVSVSGVYCNGNNYGSASISVTTGTPPYTYSWSTTPVQTSASATNLTVGNYTVQITDQTGCSAVQVAVIEYPPHMTMQVLHTVTCFNGSDGSAIAYTSGGIPPYSYLWSPTGNTGEIANGLLAGAYTVTVTDASGCTNTSTVSVTQPTVLNLGIYISNASCSTCANGSANASVNGGTSPYTYSWSPISSSSSYLQNLLPGTYTCCVTDANGCTRCANNMVRCAPPTVQASAITFTNVTNNSMTVNWTNGNGTRRIVKIKPTNSFTAPATGVDYIANPVYLGGEQTIYNGSGNSVSVTGLTAHTMYWFRVYEASCSATISGYLTTAVSGNPRQRITQALPPDNNPNRPEEIDESIDVDNSLFVYPNPATSALTLEATYMLNKIALYTTDGRIVKSIDNLHSTFYNLNLEDLSAGIYVLDCESEKGHEKVKVVKY